MSWARRRSVRIVGILLATVAVLVAAVMIFLPAEKIRDLALAQARARLGREVSVGDVSVSLRGGLGVKLSDFVIHNPDGFGGESLLKTAALDLKLDIGPLLHREVVVKRLILDEPVLNLVRRADGSDNFTFEAPGATGTGSAEPAGTGQGAPPPVTVADLSLHRGRIDYSDESAPAEGMRALMIDGVELGLSLAAPAPGRSRAQGTFAADRIVVTGPAAVPELNGTVDFDVTWDAGAGRLEITRAAGRVLDLPLDCTGSVTTGGAAPSGRLEMILKEVPVVDLAVLAPPEVAAKITGDRSAGTLGGNLTLEFTGDAAAPFHFAGQAAAANIDLALAQPFLPPQQKGRLAGRADATFKFNDAAGGPVPVTYSGTAHATGVSFTESGLVDELQKLDATLDFTPDLFTVKDCRAEFASGTFALTGSLRDPFPYFLPPEMQGKQAMKKPHLAFDLSSPRLDVDRLIPAASPTGAAKGGQPGMTRKPAVPAGVEFPDLTCAGVFRADSVIYMQVPLTNVTGQVSVLDRQVSVHDVQAAVYTGTIDGRVDIDLHDLNDPSYAGDYSAKNIEVNNFVTRFAGLAGVVFGGCNLGGTFAARGLDPAAIRSSLSLDADALLTEGKVVTRGNLHQALSKLATETGGSFDKEQALRDLATHIKVANGRVGLEGLQTRLGTFADVSVGGWYAFNGELSYEGSLQLTKSETDRIFANGAMAEVARLLGTRRPERLTLPLSVGGTRSDPKVKVDVGTVLGDLQKAVVKEQGDKLQDEAKTKLGDLLKKWK